MSSTKAFCTHVILQCSNVLARECTTALKLKNNFFNFLKVLKNPNIDSDSLAKKRAGPRNGRKTL